MSSSFASPSLNGLDLSLGKMGLSSLSTESSTKSPEGDFAYSTSEVLVLTGLVACLFQFVTTIIFHTQKHRSLKDVNTMGSLVHAVTSSVLIFTTLARAWETFHFTEEYLIYSQVGTFVRIWSSGYFISDFVSMLRDGLLHKEPGLTLHHIATIASLFGGSVLGVYGPVHLLFLLAEVNSVFLHIRALFNGAQVSRESLPYRINMLFFWASLWTCRVAISGLMFYILYEFGDAFPVRWHFWLASFGTTVISLVNFFLVYQIGFKRRRSSPKKQD